MELEKERYIDFKNSRFCNLFYELIEVVKWLEMHKIEFIFVQTPVAERIQNISNFERERIDNWEFDFNNLKQNDYEMLQSIYGCKVDVKHLMQLFEGIRVVENNGHKALLDYSSKYVNIIGGHRITLYQPEMYKNTVFMYGQCTMRGTGVEDKNTIASLLQQKLAEKGIRVENYGIGCGSDLKDDIYQIKRQKYQTGDMVVICSNLEIVPTELFEQNGIHYFDTSRVFNRPHDYGEWFYDCPFHTNDVGNQVIAMAIYNELEKCKCNYSELKKEEICFSSSLKDSVLFENEDLKEFCKNLSEHYVSGKKCGAIVMNCNPFTIGHQYLIEQVSNMVEYLYVFVVEEDKSFFSFQDRFKMVELGTKQFRNVKVLPSGKFMISLATFPGYFNKDNLDCSLVDASSDLNIFGDYIAPCLDIHWRFVGTEPTDIITNQYNRQMKEILEKKGINVIEIPRISCKGKVVSASRVRKCLQENRWEEIKDIVPKSTYEYLREKYEK